MGFRYERRRPRFTPPTAPSTHALLGGEDDACRHVFVFARGLAEAELHEARRVAECVSDAVRRPAPHLFVGSLHNTWTYFGSEEALRRAVRLRMRRTHADLRPCTVFARHLVRGFFYAHEKTSGANGASGVNGANGKTDALVTFATASALPYRRFTARITWEKWIEGVLAFLGLLQIPISTQEREAERLLHFVEQARNLHVETPGGFPELLPAADLERRFGAFVMHLWRAWCEGDPADEPRAGALAEIAAGARDRPRKESGFTHVLPPLRHLSEGLYGCELLTRGEEVESHRDAVCVPLSELATLFRETVFLCLERITAMSTLGRQYGLKSFRLEVRFDGEQEHVQDVDLVYAIHARDKHTEAVVDRITETLPSISHEIRSETEPSFFMHVTRVESLAVTPTRIVCREVSTDALFHTHPDEIHDLAGVHERMSLKDKALPRTVVVSADLDPARASTTLHAPTPARGRFDLFAYAHPTRPLQIFRPPVSLPPAVCEHLGFRFLETVEDWDYFRGSMPRSSVGLWLKSAVEERALPLRERAFFLLGLFDGET